MNLLILSHAGHKIESNKVYSYAPYVREMNLWLNHIDQLEIVAPLVFEPITSIDLAYSPIDIRLNKIPAIQFTSIKTSLLSTCKIPGILFTIFKACLKADHIHLRCPGNIGLLACFIQILFPLKKKSAKYAGNWDPASKQPSSYRLQKWILNNPFLTRNMKVMVYGEWANSSKNIVPFFTATYSEKEKFQSPESLSEPYKFLFVGTLTENKSPLAVAKIVSQLKERGYPCTLDYYGDGVLKEELFQLAQELHATGEEWIFIHGNQSKEIVKKAFEKAHFLILLSKSEGWPKVVAEAMWHGVIPISTPVSCVPWMLGFGERGVLIESKNSTIMEIISLIDNQGEMQQMRQKAMKWANQYTVERFDSGIYDILHK